MKKKKFAFALLSTLVSAGLLFGCNPGVDEEEPDPTEEPSEQMEQDTRKDNGVDEEEPDPTEEPSEQIEQDMRKDNDVDMDNNK